MRQSLLTTILILSMAIIPTAALAEDFIDPHWTESPINFSAGLKFGMAFPSDDIVQDVYGDTGIPYYNFEAGWKIVHELELHAEMSYWWADGHGLANDGSKTAERYKLHVAPAELGLLYRFHFMYDQIVVPFVGGTGMYSYFMEERLESGWKTKGSKTGASGFGGLMLLLDNFEKRASASLERAWGINDTYLVYTYKYYVLNDFDEEEGIDLSGQVHTLGVVMEF